MTNNYFTQRIIVIIIPLSIIMGLSTSFINFDSYIFESKSYGFKIEFPQKPLVSCESAQTELGVIKICNIVYDPTETNSKDENLTYLLNYTEYPASKIDSNNKQQLALLYKNTIQLTVQTNSGILNKVQTCYVKGYEGRNVVIDLKDKVQMNMQIVLVRNKMYMIEVFSKSNNSLNSSMKKFVNSFDLR